MPRKKLQKESKGLRKNYNQEDMIKAIEAVKAKKFGYLKAAKMYNVPRSTLARMCLKVSSYLLFTFSCPLKLMLYKYYYNFILFCYIYLFFFLGER